MTSFLLGLLIGVLIGLFLGAALVIYTAKKDGFDIKDGHIVSKEEVE